MRVLPGIALTVLLLGQTALAKNVYTVAEAQVGGDGIQRLEMIADSYYFEPNYLVVKVGVPVELTITRQTMLVPHNFVLHAPEAGIDVEKAIETDGTKIRFTPNKEGKYPFHCGKKLLFFESHQEKGMKGILDVRP